MVKPILCLDFDGVIHSYSSGWKGANIITDPPVAGALEFMRLAIEHFEVHIYSSRSGQEGGIEAMQAWLVRHAEYIDHRLCETDWLRAIRWPRTKPPAMISLDDRAVTFSGAWPPIKDLLDFVPWHHASKVNRGARLTNVGAFKYADLERRHLEAVQLLLDLGAYAPVVLAARIEDVLSDTLAKHAIRVEGEIGTRRELRPITPPEPVDKGVDPG